MPLPSYFYSLAAKIPLYKSLTMKKNSFRIIGGKLKRRRISCRGLIGAKPIADRRREALFNILGPLEGMVFADICAGSGIVGMEAWSRGASFVYFYESCEDNVRILKSNLAALEIKESLVLKKSCLEFPEATYPQLPPKILYFAPPWDEPALFKKFFQCLQRKRNEHLQLLVVDRPVEVPLPEPPDYLVHDDSRKYARAVLDFLIRR